MSMRVLYVNPLNLDANPAIDAMAYGLQSILHPADIQMPVLFADFREKDCHAVGSMMYTIIASTWA